MRRRSSVLLVFALLASLLPGLAASAADDDGPTVVISQVYGGGGNANAEYRNDFVELFNQGDAVQDVTGWSLQYTSANGNSWGNNATTLSGSIAPGERYLVQLAAGANADATPLPTPDHTAGINMSATNGKIALASTAAALPTDTCPVGDTVVDAVGFGTQNCAAIQTTTSLNNNASALRDEGRCGDTFSIVSPPQPENSTATPTPCGDGGEPLGPVPVISQVYGGGGNSGATLTHDFIELFNAGDAPADLSGWSVQYASSAGSTWQTTALGSVTLDPGQYLYVQQAAGAGGTVTPPADVVGSIAMAAGSGKVALVDATTALSGTCPLDGAVDLVGFGAANCFEGSGATPTLSNTTAALRADDGCTDTDDNAADFTAGAPEPRNSDSPLNPCGGGAVDAPVTATCPAFAIDAGTAGTTDVTARDRDGTVTSAEITDAPAGVTLTDVTPAETVGGTLTATVGVPDDLAAGEYDVAISFANDDDPAQTGSCVLELTVRPDPCDEPTLISDINTVGANGLPATTMTGQRVGVEAVVTADFQDGLNGFYVQEEDADADGDESTSEGIFVYTPAADEAPEVGSLVCAVGTVAMFSGSAQLTNVTVDVLDVDQPLPTAVQLKMPVDDLVEISRIAGMRVELTGQDGTMTIVQNYFLGQYGELDLSATGRLWNPTELHHPDSDEALQLRAENRRSQIKLDDANSSQNVTPTPWLDNGDVRAGAETTDVIEGIASYQFNAYRIQPTAPDDITFTNTDNPRPADAPDVLADADGAEQLTVASFNVLNYFTTLTSESSRARGADTPEEFELQAAKIVTAITKMDADVVGLIEIENNFGAENEALADLVERLNAVAGAGTYAAIELDGPVGSDAISNAFIYQPAAVTPVGETGIADQQAFVNPRNAGTDRNRPAIAQAFETPDGEVFVAVVNHLKSKGSGCGAGDDHPMAGSCNLTRTLAAQELVRWLEEDDPTGTGTDRIAIIGDLNAYAMEDPIDVLREAGYVDVFAGQLGETYSYVFDGELGRLDHGFLSAAFAEHLVAAEKWHINADEPTAFDYNDWNDPADQDTSEFRSSDHDPMLIGLQFGEAAPNQPSTIRDCMDGGWRTYTDPSFRNMGQCIAWVATGGAGPR